MLISMNKIQEEIMKNLCNVGEGEPRVADPISR